MGQRRFGCTLLEGLSGMGVRVQWKHCLPYETGLDVAVEINISM